MGKLPLFWDKNGKNYPTNENNNRKMLKDKNAPKRPMSAYFRWMNEHRIEITRQVPEGAPASAVGRKAGEMWKLVSDVEKQSYQAAFLQEKSEYQKIIEEYHKSEEYKQFKAEADKIREKIAKSKGGLKKKTKKSKKKSISEKKKKK